MRSYHPPDWEPIPIIDKWLAEVGTPVMVAAPTVLIGLAVVAVIWILRRRWATRGASVDPAPRVDRPEVHDPGGAAAGGH